MKKAFCVVAASVMMLIGTGCSNISLPFWDNKPMETLSVEISTQTKPVRAVYDKMSARLVQLGSAYCYFPTYVKKLDQASTSTTYAGYLENDSGQVDGILVAMYQEVQGANYETLNAMYKNGQMLEELKKSVSMDINDYEQGSYESEYYKGFVIKFSSTLDGKGVDAITYYLVPTTGDYYLSAVCIQYTDSQYEYGTDFERIVHDFSIIP